MFLKISLLTLGLFGTLRAQNWNQILKAVAGDRENKAVSGRTVADAFGSSVAIYGNYAVVGSTGEDEDSEGKNRKESAGAVYLFKYAGDSWSQVKKLVASDRDTYMNFGTSVAINDSYIIVGSGNKAVYIFKKDYGGSDNWGEIKKIQSPFFDSDYTGFGRSVAIEDDYIAIGATNDSYDGSGGSFLYLAGAADVFKKDRGGLENWGMIKKVTSPNRHYSDSFGRSVGISGGFLIVGAPYDDFDESQNFSVYDAGAAYLFRKDQGGEDQWGFHKKIVSSQRSYQGLFGNSVAINGERAAVGAYGEDFNYSDEVSVEVGAAYIFKKNEGGENNWARVKRITAPVGSSSDRFGAWLAISGDQVVVTADQEDHDRNEASYHSQHNFKDGLDITKLKSGVFSVQIKRATSELIVQKMLVAR